MHPALTDPVFLSLDLEDLRRVAAQGPPPVFATISGAHLYGFASPDNDVDLRGAFLLSVEDVLGLHPADETLSIDGEGPCPLDWVAHDLRKFARMMTQHNGYVMEQLYSPLVVCGGPLHEELKALGRTCLTRPMSRHYLGFARGRRERLTQPGATVKHLLYAYRVLLTGIHLMREREIEAHLPSLNHAASHAQIDELIARKRAGTEQMRLEPGELERHAQHLDTLTEDLQAARDASDLPEEPLGVAALQDFVVRARLHP